MAWFLLSLITREPLACERSLNINGSSRTGRGHAVIGLNRVPWTSSKPHVLRGLIPIALAGSKGYLQYPPAELKTSSIQIFAVKNKPFVG
ncbi:hypothetical protein PGTUg99_036762 [Puccinia graminis f. sp. tritici]|uniref:Uncharacterized protein n=1 Tax=Puccinia graminis f. sp. tritici TaxID=56615 RepID=A0A5B0NQM5_PUCGR|nr:hypothetical protein PGTUg99_036762 [Puccinia graminis f. sp. tritici]